MNPNDEKFTINWEDLKFLIEYANQGVMFSGQGAPKDDHILALETKIKKIEEKFDYKARVQRARQKEKQRFKEIAEREMQEEFKPIKAKVLELSTKFSRLFLKEIAEELKLKNTSIIRQAIEDMIIKKEINAKYFASSESVVFELK